jgi:orotate phosphoribosyltransferase
MSIDADRAELLDLLCRDGIFWSSPEQPIATATGVDARWMLDSLRVSLTPAGAELAARCLLHELARFPDGVQLATYGVTAIPLVQACVLKSGGRYRGLVVRKERKPVGAQKLIEGPLDPDLPIVLIDDSISSGTSMAKGLAILEEAGLRVLGALCLVRFGWHNGYARMQGAGYQMAHVFDVLEHFIPRVDPDRPRYPYNSTAIVPPFTWADEVAPDGIHAATYARAVLAAAVRGQPVPRPPRALDRAYDAAGGVWVSVRSRANVIERHARDGTWIYPREAPRDPMLELVHAAVRTARHLKSIEVLDASAIAVTFFGAFEECTVGQLDNDRYGIVVRSGERIEQLGGALPRMPGMTREWAQFEHARIKNAKLLPFEPYVLFRHTVDKAIEPGEPWQPTGVPRDRTPTWLDDADRAGRIAARVFAIAHALVAHAPMPAPAIPDELLGPCEAVFVSIFADGKVAGCVGGRLTALDTDLQRTTAQALADARFAGAAARAGVARLAITVSFLTSGTPYGTLAPEDMPIRIRYGEQALTVFQRSRNALLLPFVAVQQSLTPAQFVTELIDKAGITRAPYQWGTYDVATWLADDDGPRKLVWSLPPGAPPTSLGEGLARFLPLCTGYLRAHTRADGLRDGHYRPMLGAINPELELPRQIHGAWILALAGAALADASLTDLARRGLAACHARAVAPTRVEAAFLLATELALGAPPTDATRAAAAGLWAAIDRHGRIGWDPLPTGTPEAIERARRIRDGAQDYAPPQVLLVIALATAHGHTAIDPAALARALRECMHRFRTRRGWGQVCWLPMALAAWHRVTGDPALPPLAFEIIDWALTHQQDKSGGFINGDQADGPGYTTGVYLEGVAAALELAVAIGDAARIARYRDAAARGVAFLDQIIYQPRDRPFLPEPERAYGGVRMSRTAGDVRIDFVQHVVGALLALRPYAAT